MKYLQGKGCSFPGEQKTYIYQYVYEPKTNKAHSVCYGNLLD